jgi:hypothetical protein
MDAAFPADAAAAVVPSDEVAAEGHLDGLSHSLQAHLDGLLDHPCHDRGRNNSGD